VGCPFWAAMLPVVLGLDAADVPSGLVHVALRLTEVRASHVPNACDTGPTSGGTRPVVVAVGVTEVGTGHAAHADGVAPEVVEPGTRGGRLPAAEPGG
jgi:hypothetical protein